MAGSEGSWLQDGMALSLVLRGATLPRGKALHWEHPRVDLSTLSQGLCLYPWDCGIHLPHAELLEHFVEGKMKRREPSACCASLEPHGCCPLSSKLLACNSLHLHCFLVSFIISPSLTLHHVISIARLLPLPVCHITAARTHFPIF